MSPNNNINNNNNKQNIALNVLSDTAAASDIELRNCYEADMHASRSSGKIRHDNDVKSGAKEGSDERRESSDGSRSSRKASGRKAKNDELRRGKWMVSRSSVCS